MDRRRHATQEVRQWEGALIQALREDDLETIEDIILPNIREAQWGKGGIFAAASPALQKEILRAIGHARIDHYSGDIKNGVYVSRDTPFGRSAEYKEKFLRDKEENEAEVRERLRDMFQAGDFDTAHAAGYEFGYVHNTPFTDITYEYADASPEQKNILLQYFRRECAKWRDGVYDSASVSGLDAVMHDFSIPKYPNADEALQAMIVEEIKASLCPVNVKAIEMIARTFIHPLIDDFFDIPNHYNTDKEVWESVLEWIKKPMSDSEQQAALSVKGVFKEFAYKTLDSEAKKDVLDTIFATAQSGKGGDAKHILRIFSFPNYPYADIDTDSKQIIREKIIEHLNNTDFISLKNTQDAFNVPLHAITESELLAVNKYSTMPKDTRGKIDNLLFKDLQDVGASSFFRCYTIPKYGDPDFEILQERVHEEIAANMQPLHLRYLFDIRSNFAIPDTVWKSLLSQVDYAADTQSLQHLVEGVCQRLNSSDLNYDYLKNYIQDFRFPEYTAMSTDYQQMLVETCTRSLLKDINGHNFEGYLHNLRAIEEIFSVPDSVFPQSPADFCIEELRKSNPNEDLVSEILSYSNTISEMNTFAEEVRVIARDSESSLPERQRAFRTLALLIKSGMTSLSDEMCEIITDQTKQKEISEEGLGLDPLQESALYTMMYLDNTDTNAALFKMLSQDSVHPDIKHAVTRKLLKNNNSFLQKEVKERLHNLFYADKQKEVDWNDLQFLDAVQKISSKSLKESALAAFAKAEIDAFSHRDWQEHFSVIPQDVYVQLCNLCGSDGQLLEKFRGMYAAVHGDNRIKEDLLYSITKVLEVKPHILSLTIERLKEIDFSTQEDAGVLSKLLRRIIFLDAIASSQMALWHATKDVLSGQVVTLAALADHVEKLAAELFQKILPHQGITAEAVTTIEDKWGEIEPILTYLGKFPDLKEYIAEVVAHFSDWKAWRYSSDRGESIEDQVGHLSSEQMKIWQDDYFTETGEALIAEQSGKPEKLCELLHDAIVQDAHIYNTETDGDEYIQTTLASVFERIAEEPHNKEAIITDALAAEQARTEHLNAITEYANLQRLESSIAMLTADTVKQSSKMKNTIGFVANYLPSDLGKELQANYAAQQPPLTREMEQVLHAIPAEIEEKFRAAMDSDVWDELNLNKDALKNKKQFHTAQKRLKSITDILHLTNLTAKNIAFNKTIEKENMQSGEAITTTLERLKKYFGEKTNKKGEVTEAASPFYGDLENIEEILSEQSAFSEKRRLAMLFTDDPQILWQVGKYPIGSGSCQNYAGSDLAKKLMGYVADPNCKAAYIIDINNLPQDIRSAINEHGFSKAKDTVPAQSLLEASVSRKMVKIAKDIDNQPIILMERSYGVKDMDSYFNSFINQNIAEPMDARMVESGGNKSITVGKSASPEGQYEDANLHGVRFITVSNEE